MRLLLSADFKIMILAKMETYLIPYPTVLLFAQFSQFYFMLLTMTVLAILLSWI
jgi:hypothetical protein